MSALVFIVSAKDLTCRRWASTCEVGSFRVTLHQPAPLSLTQLSPKLCQTLRNAAKQGKRHQISPEGSTVLAWEKKTARHGKWILRMIIRRKLRKVIRQLAQPPRLFLCARSKVEMISAIFDQLLSLASHVPEWVRLMQRVLTVARDTAVTSELRCYGWVSFVPFSLLSCISFTLCWINIYRVMCPSFLAISIYICLTGIRYRSTAPHAACARALLPGWK